MRHRKAVNRLSRPSGHRQALLRNLAKSLFEHGRIVTTEAKAKELRPFAEKLITRARRNTQHSTRLVFSRLGDKTATKRLVTEVAPQHAGRAGGYLRITKMGHRNPNGDGAAMAMIEIIAPAAGEAPKEKPKRRRRAAPKKSDAAEA
ncbi:MAG: 50S ribosomal protein L17 [Candidatus Sumerlaeia bacterium]|nr:50S ribosomal protein L17 [Candidatus Sumerlaeia bacterium]